MMTGDDDESVFAKLGQRGLVSRMHDQLDELLAARDQMEQLLRVVVEIGSDLDLQATLHRIVVAAMELTSARYGALAIRDPDGTLVSFVHAGIDAETVRRIGHLPVGKGVLDVSLVHNHPLRLDDLTSHPTAVGFPAHHPAMHALLSVPITIRSTVFGNLYLTHDEPLRIFSESDETAAAALASAAAVAIDNARMYERLRAASRWMSASREITTALLAGTGAPARPLQLIAERVCELIEAEQAVVLVPTEDDLPDDEVENLVVSAAVGVHAVEVIGQQVPVDGSTSGGVFRSGVPLITEAFDYPIEAFTDVGQRPAIAVPLRSDGDVRGVLLVARNKDQPAFDEGSLELASDFANHAAVALALATSRQYAHELAILTDRERIAHDLHDHVIQRIFAAGLDLQGTIARAHSPEVIARLDRTVNDLQNVIGEIRSTIFQLQSPAPLSPDFGQRIQQAIATLTEDRGIVTTVHMEGPMSVVGAEIAEQAEAVITEAVSNALRHSGASRLTVDIRAADMLSIDITDNGRGIPPDNQRRSGLANMQYRADRVGGSCAVSAPPGGGTRVCWTAPLTVG